jgi:hypothetical protein
MIWYLATCTIRAIPLNPDVLESAKALLLRAQQLGACQPEHYLIRVWPIQAHQLEGRPQGLR